MRQPGLSTEATPQYQSYLLVAPFKFSARPLLEKTQIDFSKHRVSLEAVLIYRDKQTMLEIKPESIHILQDTLDSPDSLSNLSKVISATPVDYKEGAEITLRGEIIDSKCYLGAMKPSTRKVHRACAIRCLSGGIPPLFLVYTELSPEDKSQNQALVDTGSLSSHIVSHSLLLVDHNKRALNKDILHLVAKPIEIQGTLEKAGSFWLIKWDPSRFREL